MVRLEPMSEAEFQASLRRAIPRHAADQVTRGVWTEAEALETSRLEFDQLLPEGRSTPFRHFLRVVDPGTGATLGETWCSFPRKGGRVQFWVDWLWIEPAHRRRGHASAVLDLLERQAEEMGADRIGLTVFVGNDAARTLYVRRGYRDTNMRMAKRLSPAPPA